MKAFLTFIFTLAVCIQAASQNLADSAVTSFSPASHDVEVLDILPRCAEFVKSVESCVPKISCRIKLNIAGEDNSKTFAVLEKMTNGSCKMILSNKEKTSTFVTIFEFNPADLKSAKRIVEAYAQSKGKFSLTTTDNCCNKDENAKEIKYCKTSLRGQTIDNVFASSSNYTCKGKVIKPVVEKEFRYND